MKIHRITCLIVDPNHPDTPASEYIGLLENCKYVYPTVLSVESAEIGEWDDAHPLNHSDRAIRDAAIAKAFESPIRALPESA